MPIDPSIIAGLRPPTPVTVEDPISSYGKALQIKALMGQGKLQDLQMQTAQQDLEENQGSRAALKASIGPNGEFDQGGYLKNLAAGGYAKSFQTERKNQIDAREKLANIDSKEAETINKTIDGWKSLIPQVQNYDDAVAWVKAMRGDKKIGPHLQQLGSEDQQIANIPRDPKGLQDWMLKQQNGMKSYQDVITQRAAQAETARGHDQTYSSSMYGHQVAARGQDLRAQEKERALNPLGLNLPGFQSQAAPAALPPTPGGMPVNPGAPAAAPSQITNFGNIRPVGASTGFQQFPTPEAGLAAVDKNLQAYGQKGINTISGIINRWAPPSENNTSAYIADVSQRLGIKPDQPLDMNNPMIRQALGTAIAIHEHGPQKLFGGGGQPAAAAPSAAPTREPIDFTLTGEDFLKQLPPEVANQVKAYATGRRAFPAGAAMRAPIMDQYLKLVAAYDPEFDATDFNKRNKTAMGFATGKQGDAVRAVNQAINHAGSLNNTIEALDNSNLYGANLVTPLVNATKRKIFNDATQGEFKFNANALASEIRKVFAGAGGGNLTELKQWEEGLPLNESKGQQQKYLKKGIELLNGGIEALNDQYRSGFGQKANIMENDSLIKPKAREILNKLGGIESAPATPAQVSQVPAGWSVTVKKP